MCFGGNNKPLRSIGDAEAAARSGDMKRYHELGGHDGDVFRERLRRLGPKQDPLARLGIFQIQDSKGAGAETFRHEANALPSQASNPFYTSIARQTPDKRSTQHNNPYVPKVK